MIYPFRKTVFDCKQATLLSVKRAEGKITLFERVKLSYHLFYCDPCRRFISQWQQLDRAGKEMGTAMWSKPPMSLSEETRSRMQKIIETL
jgi:hypothetical protein